MLASGVADGTFTQEEIDSWWASLEADDRAGHYFMTFQGFIVAGTKGALPVL